MSPGTIVAGTVVAGGDEQVVAGQFVAPASAEQEPERASAPAVATEASEFTSRSSGASARLSGMLSRRPVPAAPPAGGWEREHVGRTSLQLLRLLHVLWRAACLVTIAHLVGATLMAACPHFHSFLQFADEWVAAKAAAQAKGNNLNTIVSASHPC